MGSHQQTTKMGEGSKQVRVDNWGIFFLQRLQMFFNKTDYCDLTLEFEGNVQLKVHRLVMNACTDYFQILERTCNVVDDVLVMPSDLQADVVLPIVNFMYTGMLEFHMSIFDKLYKTANVMNITVLTKLLDAQKTPIAPLPKPANKRNSQIPHTWNLQGKKISAKMSDSDLPATLPGRKLPVWKRKSAPTAVPHTIVPHFYPEQKRTVQVDPLAMFDNAPKPTRFEWPEDDLSTLNLFDSSFDDISYTSKPLLTQDDEPRPSTSFDRIKDTPDSYRRPTSYSNAAVDMEDVKDYVKEQKIRSNMTEEDDDDAVDNDFDTGEIGGRMSSNQESQKRKLKFEPSPSKRVRFNVNEKENQIKQAKINITPTGKSSAEVDHTKIISEVLKKYPNLVKKNKNIRLKILAKSNNTPVVVDQVKKPIFKRTPSKLQLQAVTSTPISKAQKVVTEEKNDEEGPWKCQRCSTPNDPVEFVLYYLFRKHMTDVHNEKFDSRMCKFCGHKSTKQNMLMYHQYTKHGIKPPPAYKFPKCSQCPYIALTESLLIKHKMNHTKYELQCVECKVTFANQQALTLHVQITGHTGKSDKPNYDCQYCTKKFQTGATLFSHIRQLHRDEARRDGIVSIDESEDFEGDTSSTDQQTEQEEEYITPEMIVDKRDKVKILSDVKLPSMEIQHSNSLGQQNVALEPSSEAEALSNVASGIATSLGLVDVVVLDENQQYILHADNQQGIASGESEFILPDLQDNQTFATAQQVITSEQNVITQSMLHNSDIGSTDELVMVLTDHDYGDGNSEIMHNDNSNIVVLYSHPIEGQENQFITSQGNLMLTSQAGLIELRNGNTVVTSAGSHFITTPADRQESGHIESIEMIQREINQHPDVKNQIHLVQDIKPTLVHEVAHSPITGSTEIQQIPQHLTVQTSPESEVENLDVLHENDANEQVYYNALQDITTDEQTEVNVEDPTTDETVKESKSEGSEDQDRNVENNITEQQCGDQESFNIIQQQSVESDSNTCEMNQQNTEHSQVQFDNNQVAEVASELQDSSSSCGQNAELTEAEGVKPSDVEKMETEDAHKEEFQSSREVPEETTKSLTEAPVSELMAEDEQSVSSPAIQPQEETSKSIEDTQEEEILANSEIADELDASEEVPHHVGSDSPSDEVSELSKCIDEDAQKLSSMESEDTTVDTADVENSIAVPESQKVPQEIHENIPTVDTNHQSQENNENSELHLEQSQLEHENLKVDAEISPPNKDSIDEQNLKLPFDGDSSKLQEEQVNDNSQMQEESSQEDDIMSLAEDGTSQAEIATSAGEVENSQLESENSQMDENSELQESFQSKDENLQLSNETLEVQVENANVQNESSSSSSIAKIAQNGSNQSAKIILDDWEDTDSQQSDSKNGTTVHKLIDDWDDDEEEKKSTV